MTESKNTGDKTTGAAPRKPLGLKRGNVERDVVRQSFSHGRTNTVQVERKKRRVTLPGEGKPEAPVAAAPARPVAARSAATSAPAPAPAPSGREQAARPKRDRVRARDMGAARRASGTTHPGAVAPAQRPAGADRAPDGAAGPATEPSRAGGGSGGGGTAPAPRAPAATAPAASAPAASDPAPADPVTGAVGAATGGLLGDGVPLPSVPPPPSPPVLDTSNPVSGLGNLPATVQSTVEQTVDGVGATVAGAAGTAGAATQGLSDTVTGVGQRLGGG